MGDGKIVVSQHAHAQIHRGPDRIEVRVIFLFGDRESGNANRQHPLDAPDEKCKGSLGRHHLDSASGQQRRVGNDQGALGVEQHLQGRQLRVDTHGRGGGLALFELVGSIKRQFADGDGLHRWAAQAQHFGPGAILARGLRL